MKLLSWWDQVEAECYLNAGIKYTLNSEIKTQDVKHEMNKMDTIQLGTESQCQELQDC